MPAAAAQSIKVAAGRASIVSADAARRDSEFSSENSQPEFDVYHHHPSFRRVSRAPSTAAAAAKGVRPASGSVSHHRAGPIGTSAQKRPSTALGLRQQVESQRNVHALMERRNRPSSSVTQAPELSASSSEESEGHRGPGSLTKAYRYGVLSTKKTLNSYILPPKASAAGQQAYTALMARLAAELNKQRALVETKRAAVMQLRDDNRENLTLLSGVPENIALNARLQERKRRLEHGVTELEAKSLEASTYALTLKLLEERNVVTLSDIKRRIKELEQDFERFEGVCEKVTSQSLRVHNQTLEQLDRYHCEEARLLRDREYQERYCESLRRDLEEVVQREEEWQEYNEQLEHVAKCVRENEIDKSTRCVRVRVRGRAGAGDRSIDRSWAVRRRRDERPGRPED